MKSFIISIYIWSFFLLTIILFFPFIFIFWILIFPLDKDHINFHFFTARLANIYIVVNPWWKLSIEGKEKIDQKKKYIIISNHQSLLDILTLYQLRCKYKWVAKEELFNVPVLGWIMKMNGYIPVKRGDTESSLRMMEKCKLELSKGISIFMFPEGTRSENGTLLKFKEGAFRMALETNTDILPVIIMGASEALPKKGILIKKPQKISIKVLDVIPSESIAKKSPENLAIEIREIMQSQMNF